MLLIFGIALIKSWINAITSKAKELVSNPIFGAILMNNPLTSGLVGWDSFNKIMD